MNGYFEIGNWNEWIVLTQGRIEESFYIGNENTTPTTGYQTVGPMLEEHIFAITDQYNTGTHILYQDFVIPKHSTAIISFDIFINDQDNERFINSVVLDYNDIVNQYRTLQAVVKNIYVRIDNINNITTMCNFSSNGDSVRNADLRTTCRMEIGAY